MLASIVYLVKPGCSWRKLPAALFGVSRPTVHRRFTAWTAEGLWERLHQQLLHRLNVASEIDWSRAVVDSTYDQKALRAEVRRRGIAVRIARKGVDSSQRLGRHRWIVEPASHG